MAMNASGQYAIAWDSWANYVSIGPIRVVGGDLAEAMPGPTVVADKWSVQPFVSVGQDGTRMLSWTRYAPASAKLSADGALAWPSGENVAQAPIPQSNLPGGLMNSGAQGQIGGAYVIEPSSHSDDVVMFSQRTADGSLAPAQVVNTESTEGGAFDPSVTFDQGGVPTVSWSRGEVSCQAVTLLAVARFKCKPVNDAVEVANGDGQGGFGPAQLVAAGCEEPTLDEAPSGAAVIFMPCARGMRYAYRDAGQPFGKPMRIATGRLDTGVSDMKLLPDGRVIVVFEQTRQTSDVTFKTRLAAAVGVLGEALSNPHPLTKFRTESGVDDSEAPADAFDSRRRSVTAVREVVAGKLRAIGGDKG